MIFRRLLTIVFGALPATWLGVFAAMGIWTGALMVIGNLTALDLFGVLGSLVIFVWSLLGLYGAVSLWAVGVGFVNSFSTMGLVAGLIAAFPFVMFIVLTGDLGIGGLSVLFPTIVGCAWLMGLHSSDSNRDVDDELERDLVELRKRGTSW